MALYSAGVEYGIHCLIYLADEKGNGREASVRALAELQGVPPELLAKVFTRLAKAGLVAATEGVRGGFRLARPADEITVLDIVRAIDGDKQIFDLVDEYSFRHRVKPGITGLAQVNGYRGAIDTPEHLRARIDYDLYYIDHWSLWLDIKILFRTAAICFTGVNAF